MVMSFNLMSSSFYP